MTIIKILTNIKIVYRHILQVKCGKDGKKKLKFNAVPTIFAGQSKRSSTFINTNVSSSPLHIFIKNFQ